MKHSLILILIFICNILTNANAYNKPFAINFSKENYQAGNKNWSIDEDELGVVYLGNDIGLLTFDGIEWQLNKPNKHALLRSVAVASHNTVFTGGYEEFGRWDRNKSGVLEYTSISDMLDDESFKNDDFWKIWIRDSLVYFQSFNGIYCYDYKDVKKIDSDKLFLFLTKVRDEFMVQEMRGQLYRMESGKLNLIKNSHVFNNTDVRVILPFGNKAYLIGTAINGLYIYDGESFREWDSKLSAIMKQKELNCAILGKDDYYYLGTILDGIYVVDTSGRIVDHLNTDNILQDNTVLSLFEDDLSNVWAGLDRGISYVQKLNNMSYFNASKGGISSIYDAVLWNKSLFLGTNQGVYYISESDLAKSDGVDNMRLINGTQGQVWSFDVIDNKLYCNHNRGVMEITSNSTVRSVLHVGATHSAEYTINNTKVLVMSTYSGLRIINKNTGKETHPLQIDEPIAKTEIDHLGNIWLEHANKGVYRCRINSRFDSLYHIKTYGGINDALPFDLKIFKVGGRIVLLGNGRFYTYDDINDEVVSDETLNRCFENIQGVKQVVAIKNNLYWALSSTSIFRFSYDGYEAFVLDAYNISANNLSLVNAYENVSILNDSLNLVCLDNGFLLYNNRNIHETKQAKLEKPYLSSVEFTTIGGKDTAFIVAEKGRSMRYSHNTVDFKFSAQHVFAKNSYIQYRLKGLYEEWSEPVKSNHVQYARLPKGEYVFQVKCVDNLGQSSEVLEYSFEILPPWYQSSWAYLTYVFLVIFVIYLIWWLVRRRYNKLMRKREKELESKRLKIKNEQLQLKIDQKNSELMTQASFFIQKNELIFRLKSIIDDFYERNKSSQMVELYRRINVLLNNNLNTEEDWKMFLIKFEEKHTGFFKKMKHSYPELTNSDLRLCACLKLNMDTKDIAALMNLSVRAVENSRYRLRKKLDLQPNQNLTDHILEID